MQPAAFSRGERLRKRPDFLLVQQEGQRSSAPHFILFTRARPVGAGRRMGVTVSRKVGGAVLRNRVKRLVREAFRRCKASWPVDRDLVFIAKTHAVDLRQSTVTDELQQLLRRLPRSPMDRTG